jgi:hypothetical protein
MQQDAVALPIGHAAVRHRLVWREKIPNPIVVVVLSAPVVNRSLTAPLHRNAKETARMWLHGPFEIGQDVFVFKNRNQRVLGRFHIEVSIMLIDVLEMLHRVNIGFCYAINNPSPLAGLQRLKFLCYFH